MKFDQLNYFISAAKEEHIGNASKQVGISPSAISHSIRALEEELGEELFIKQGKRIFLTEFGKRFQAKAEKLMEQANQLKDNRCNCQQSHSTLLLFSLKSEIAPTFLVMRMMLAWVWPG